MFLLKIRALPCAEYTFKEATDSSFCSQEFFNLCFIVGLIVKPRFMLLPPVHTRQSLCVSCRHQAGPPAFLAATGESS